MKIKWILKEDKKRKMNRIQIRRSERKIILVGDTSASQVVGLTEEITAIVTNARPERGDKVRKTFSNLSVTK